MERNIWQSVEETRGHLLNIARKLAPKYGVCEVDVEDVVQETMLDAWKHIQNYAAERGRIITWLTLLLRSNLIDACRKNSTYRHKVQIFMRDQEVEILRDLNAAETDIVISEMSDIQHAIIDLVSHGWTIKDISEITGLSKSCCYAIRSAAHTTVS
jgi:RNA polymerase sigma factor (sigma-70 family)